MLPRHENEHRETAPLEADRFVTTHWSLVIAAGQRESPESADALVTLCTAYWYPLYAFVRYRGYSADDARDLTQSFFARIIETNGFASASTCRRACATTRCRPWSSSRSSRTP